MLRRPYIRRVRPNGFTLAELVISVAVLSVMILLAGQVMNLTVQSTGQATALTTTTQRLRAFEETLREDLRHVPKGQSVMLIQGNPVNAYWTQAGKDADNNGNAADGYPNNGDPERADPLRPGQLSPPRADILMYFTSRTTSSYVRPGVSSSLEQVVIGHARIGDYVAEPTGEDQDGDGGPYRFTPGLEAFPAATNGSPSATIPSPIPAELWHLARRAVLLLPPPAIDTSWPKVLHSRNSPTDRGIRLLRGQEDVVDNFNFAARVSVPQDPPWTSGDPPTGSFPFYLPAIFEGTPDPFGARPFQRSELDPTPPALYANRLGAYMLPHCASFKVEWSLDPRSAMVGGRLNGEDEVYWIDPGHLGNPQLNIPSDPFYAIQRKIDELRAVDPDDQRAGRLEELVVSRQAPSGPYTLAQRFRDEDNWRLPPSGDRTNTHLFTASRVNTDGVLVPDDVFPQALRITVDVFDDERRLERPIRHVMVIPIGE